MAACRRTGFAEGCIELAVAAAAVAKAVGVVESKMN